MRLFDRLTPEKQDACRERYGAWYEAKQQYLHALTAYEACKDYDAALQVIERDAGILLSSLDPAELLERLGRCPVETLKRHPFAILVLMRCMFNWRQIPKMMELKQLLLTTVAEHPEWSQEEKGSLLGGVRPDPELSHVQRYLCHEPPAPQRQCADVPPGHQHPEQRWVDLRFSLGADDVPPSARSAGRELAEMDECMPHYYKITNGHGMGAETIMPGRSRSAAGTVRRRADPVGACLCTDRGQRSDQHDPLL